MGHPLNLLLDTCTLIWLCCEPNKLSPDATQALDRPENRRFLSMASLWEIVIKHGSNKLPLPESPDSWIETQTRLQDIEILPLERQVIYQSGLLPSAHRDPFDRWIAAETRFHCMTLVSPDRPFRDFGCETVW